MIRHAVLIILLLLIMPAVAPGAPPPPQPPGPPPPGASAFTLEDLSGDPAAASRRFLNELAGRAVAVHGAVKTSSEYGWASAEYVIGPSARLNGLCAAQALWVNLSKATDGKYYQDFARVREVVWTTGPLSRTNDARAATEACTRTAAAAKYFEDPKLFDLGSTLLDIQTAAEAAGKARRLHFRLSCGSRNVCSDPRRLLAAASMANLIGVEHADCDRPSRNDCYTLLFEGAPLVVMTVGVVRPVSDSHGDLEWIKVGNLRF